jgi:hypothetical protein
VYKKITVSYEGSSDKNLENELIRLLAVGGFEGVSTISNFHKKTVEIHFVREEKNDPKI